MLTVTSPSASTLGTMIPARVSTRISLLEVRPFSRT